MKYLLYFIILMQCECFGMVPMAREKNLYYFSDLKKAFDRLSPLKKVILISDHHKEVYLSKNLFSANSASIILGNCIADCDTDSTEIRLPILTENQLRLLIKHEPYLKKNSENLLKERLEKSSLYSLFLLYQTADYLDIPTLEQISLDTMVNKITSKENVQNFTQNGILPKEIIDFSQKNSEYFTNILENKLAQTLVKNTDSYQSFSRYDFTRLAFGTFDADATSDLMKRHRMNHVSLKQAMAAHILFQKRKEISKSKWHDDDSLAAEKKLIANSPWLRIPEYAYSPVPLTWDNQKQCFTGDQKVEFLGLTEDVEK